MSNFRKKNKVVQLIFDPKTGEVKKPEKKPKGIIHPKNKLNNLTGDKWIQFTKSWFVEDGKPSDITKEIELHPASFPPPMIKDFIGFFTKKGQWVLDPFLGTGSTLVACDETGRKGVGIELYKKYANTARSRTDLEVILGNASEIIPKLNERGLKFHLCITSPPYWNILKKEKDYTQQARAKKGLDLRYGNNEADFGLISTYQSFLGSLGSLFASLSSILAKGSHVVIIIQNFRHEGETIPLAFDLTTFLRKHYKFQGAKIWCQNQKTLRPYGYPYSFVSNVHHHYCLIFKKP